MTLSYALIRAARTLDHASDAIDKTVDEALPLFGKAGEALDQVSGQLANAEKITGPAADAVDAAERSARAVIAGVARADHGGRPTPCRPWIAPCAARPGAHAPDRLKVVLAPSDMNATVIAYPRSFAGQFVIGAFDALPERADGVVHRLNDLGVVVFGDLRVARVRDADRRVIGAFLGHPLDYRRGCMLGKSVGLDRDRVQRRASTRSSRSSIYRYAG